MYNFKMIFKVLFTSWQFYVSLLLLFFGFVIGSNDMMCVLGMIIGFYVCYLMSKSLKKCVTVDADKGGEHNENK